MDNASEGDPKTYAIIGAGMEVHREMGCGFLEPSYQEAFAEELALQKIPFEREVVLDLYYKSKKLQTGYRADFFCFGEVIVELKAIKKITDIEIAQLINYLKVTGKKVGLILNFGGKSLEWERRVY